MAITVEFFAPPGPSLTLLVCEYGNDPTRTVVGFSGLLPAPAASPALWMGVCL